MANCMDFLERLEARDPTLTRGEVRDALADLLEGEDDPKIRMIVLAVIAINESRGVF